MIRWTLNKKILLYLSVVLLIGAGVALWAVEIQIDYLEQEGIEKAELFNRMVMEIIESYIRAGSSSEEIMEVIKNLSNIENIKSLKVIRGPLMEKMLGVDPEKIPSDDLERRALKGEEIKIIYNENGDRFFRKITPIYKKNGCMIHHYVEGEEVMGAISSVVSYKSADRYIAREKIFIITLFITIIVLPLTLLFFLLSKFVIRPLKKIQKSVEILGKTGDLPEKVKLQTGDELGELATSINMMADDLKKYREALIASELKYKDLFESVPDIIFSLNSKGEFISVNKSITYSLGYSTNEIVGKNFSEIVYKDDLEDAQKTFRDLLWRKKELRRSLRVRLLRKNEDIRYFDIKASPRYDKSGKPLKIDGVARDVTMGKRLREKELEREKMMASIKSLGNILVTLSHYINNSTAVISGWAHLSNYGEESNIEKMRKACLIETEKISAVLKSLRKMIDNMQLKTLKYSGVSIEMFDIEEEIKQKFKKIESKFSRGGEPYGKA